MGAFIGSLFISKEVTMAATKIKMVKEESAKDIESLMVTLKDKRITSVHIGNSYIHFVNGQAEIPSKVYALLKDSGVEVE